MCWYDKINKKSKKRGFELGWSFDYICLSFLFMYLSSILHLRRLFRFLCFEVSSFFSLYFSLPFKCYTTLFHSLLFSRQSVQFISTLR